MHYEKQILLCIIECVILKTTQNKTKSNNFLAFICKTCWTSPTKRPALFSPISTMRSVLYRCWLSASKSSSFRWPRRCSHSTTNSLYTTNKHLHCTGRVLGNSNGIICAPFNVLPHSIAFSSVVQVCVGQPERWLVVFAASTQAALEATAKGKR